MPEWIPIENREPPKGELALFCGIKGGIFLGTYLGVRPSAYGEKRPVAARDRDGSTQRWREVIAWLPVPAPYLDEKRLAAFKKIEAAYLFRPRRGRRK